MFYSILTVMLTVITLSIVIPSIILWKTPNEIIKSTAYNLIKDRKILLHFFALLLILYFNKLEQKIGENLLSSDYTHIIRNWEGNLVYYIQNIFLNNQLTFILTFFYIILFPTLMVASLIIYLNSNDFKSFYSFTYALMLNYGLAIPFFLFFPVYEVWYYDSNVKFLIPEVYSNFEQEYRKLSGINNNFPSLHTSISLTMAFIATRSTCRKFARLVMVSAFIILFSTVYLGIHWLTDLAAGALLAIIASKTGFRLSDFSVTENELYARNR